MNSARRIKLRVAPPKPRNPLVAAAAQRKAGSHRKAEAARRRADKIALQKELRKA
ncbi:hypothetical protein GCM10027034_16420 [Ramlibacter solisilvae]|uniref:hypothetical protein n=1 Tax=Ramlibacter tataouinensis TaxID=94132 RepID=UPI00156FFCD9|nr:hypothetical protein [Ramlibacter tataouinensis]